MADVEMSDESVAALPAPLSTPVEVERAVLEQEGETGAASMEVEGSPPETLALEQTQPTPERTQPIQAETVSADGRGAAGKSVEGEPGRKVEDARKSPPESLTEQEEYTWARIGARGLLLGSGGCGGAARPLPPHFFLFDGWWYVAIATAATPSICKG